VGEIPSVYRWPYDYSKPGSKEDYIPQHIPFSETPESNLPSENELIKLETSNGDGKIVVEGDKH
jgi:cytochrome c oxidase subunit 1